MARKRNPRVVALEILKNLKADAAAIHSRLTIRSRRTVYDAATLTDASGREYAGSVTRQRRPEEYPENQSGEWANLWVYAHDMEERAAALKALALAEWKKFPGNAGYTLTRPEA